MATGVETNTKNREWRNTCEGRASGRSPSRWRLWIRLSSALIGTRSLPWGASTGLARYILSYMDKLPAGETEYAFGIFSVGSAGPNDVVGDTDLANVGEIAGDYRIAITDRERISSVLEMLRTADGVPDQFVGLDLRWRNRTLHATFQPTGIEKALQYLGCFE